nr:MAG TPA: hypothetical protein [Caudoviricetes sp.]
MSGTNVLYYHWRKPATLNDGLLLSKLPSHTIGHFLRF